MLEITSNLKMFKKGVKIDSWVKCPKDKYCGCKNTKMIKQCKVYLCLTNH